MASRSSRAARVHHPLSHLSTVISAIETIYMDETMSCSNQCLTEPVGILTLNTNGTPAKAPLSVLIPVKNEARNLRRCLRALGWVDEIFVVDSQSTDETAKVAVEFGATVVQ